MRYLIIASLLVVGCEEAFQSSPEETSLSEPEYTAEIAFPEKPILPKPKKKIEEAKKVAKKDASPPLPVPVPKALKQRGPAILLPQAQEDALLTFFPKSDIPALAELKQNAIFYNDSVVPRLYQKFDGGRDDGLFDSLAGQDTSNNEFPWRNAAGLRDGVKTIHFVDLKGIDVHRSTDIQGNFTGFDWTYRTGTTFGEIILVSHPQRGDLSAILRTRTKKEDGQWRMNTYEPFPTEDDFREALAKRNLRFEEGQVFVDSVDSSLAPTNHQRNIFRATSQAINLPTMDESLVVSLLQEPFKIGTDKLWIARDDAHIVSPTTNQPFSIVPQGFQGHNIFKDSESCMQCHRDAGKVVNLQQQKRWRLRGGDGIFSFHPFDPDSNQIQVNPKLARAGLVRFHDQGVQ